MLITIKFCTIFPIAENPVSMIYFASPPKTRTYSNKTPNKYIQILARRETPLIPFITAKVYTKHVTIKIPIVTNFELSIPTRLVNAADSKGVATENVVAVPAIKAITAKTSINFPCHLSVLFPRRARQASEYFCFFTPRTCSMKPKHAANVA